ncbi:OmpA family protein [Cognatiyoonia koreensis]|uniref:OmpA family protein n=2 Tax=Cognatiyoonia koreensis TaxID=364200 RepID=A0A1I0RC58_9RHOB|nr:OmpA family protein [Cognatiyoonia koreensis]
MRNKGYLSVAKMNFQKTKAALAGVVALTLAAGQVQAEGHERVIQGEEYTPTIWIDPDGCQHWVMDDGFEGFMSPHRTRDGRPVCNRSEICGVIPTDTLFATDEAWITRQAKAELMSFFQNANAFGFLIYGHTDSRASDEYNIRLSEARANMVASVARDAGVRVVDVKGFGERQPRAQGHSAQALQQNRRVEIYCIR